MISIRQKLPGILLCFSIALISWQLGNHLPVVGAPIFAIFIGMIISLFYSNKKSTLSGINFTSKYILQTAVVLLGFSLNFLQIMKVGTQSLPIIISTISVSLIVTYILQKILHININTAILVGVGSAICGGSAIAASAPIIHANDEEIVQSISVIFLFNILAAMIFPLMGEAIGLSNDAFAIFAGTAVNDTSSVTATATVWDTIHHSNTLDSATIVKLTRTLAIIPITFGLSIIKNFYFKKVNDNKKSKFKLKNVFPTFLLYFLLASLFTTILSLVHIEFTILNSLKLLSKFLIVMAMSAVGLNANPIKLITSGRQAIILGSICWGSIICISLMMQYLLGLW